MKKRELDGNCNYTSILIDAIVRKMTMIFNVKEAERDRLRERRGERRVTVV